jgi:hypothetical protein
MHEMDKYIFFVLGIITAAVVSGIGGKSGGPAGEVAVLNQRYADLDRDYRDRQRTIESGIDECLGIVERAGAIAERTGHNAGRAIGNLREASDLIKEGIAERESLKSELLSLRAGLLRLRNMGGEADEINAGVKQ